MGHFNTSMRHLRAVVESRQELDATAREVACRHAMLIGTTLEFLKSEALLDGIADPVSDALDLGELAAAAAFLLSTLCLSGPPALHPSLVPCLGFVLRGHFSLLCTQDA